MAAWNSRMLKAKTACMFCVYVTVNYLNKKGDITQPCITLLRYMVILLVYGTHFDQMGENTISWMVFSQLHDACVSFQLSAIH